MEGPWKPVGLMCVAVSVCLLAPVAAAGQSSDEVTFTKDVLPILQRSCQKCHRPGTAAPMSLLTYDEARPWAALSRTASSPDRCLRGTSTDRSASLTPTRR